jgi:iron complex outermembrane receptor protein
VDDDFLKIGTIKLRTMPLQSQPIIVTAGRYEQAIQDVSASIGVITKEEIEYRNAVSLDRALQYVSGINLTGTQINIRGASGYSRGVGSRVLMMVDGIPYLTGDTKEANFESFQMKSRLFK